MKEFLQNHSLRSEVFRCGVIVSVSSDGRILCIIRERMGRWIPVLLQVVVEESEENTNTVAPFFNLGWNDDEEEFEYEYDEVDDDEEDDDLFDEEDDYDDLEDLDDDFDDDYDDLEIDIEEEEEDF